MSESDTSKVDAEALYLALQSVMAERDYLLQACTDLRNNWHPTHAHLDAKGTRGANCPACRNDADVRERFIAAIASRPQGAPLDSVAAVLHFRDTGKLSSETSPHTDPKQAALIREIHARHGRISKLLWGPGARPGMILGPMDSDNAHTDRGTLLSMLTPEQTGCICDPDCINPSCPVHMRAVEKI